MSEIICAYKLSKKYRDINALVDVSFTLKKGIWGIIGPNGAGKTTLLNLIWGIIHPSSGDLSVLDHDPKKDDLQLKVDIGVCFTSQKFPYGYVCKDYLTTVSKAYGVSFKSSIPLILSLLKKLELKSILEREINSLSSGMKQKLAIIQCLIGYPSLAVMDEPFANLDPLAKISVRELILEFYQNSGTSFLISSHSLEDLRNFCTGYLFINQGRLLWKGTHDEIPQNDLVEFYLEYVKKTL
ncbi:hypothetical protein CEE45_17755 [Candidatus Heimdallarchaeota archaeon B3_Heim]|nr:MAG: hypothetical protein CEE45_17755 [Candidatus Heimdallarchaeota archaeon B3_Heim]